jgi:hypothetical protein
LRLELEETLADDGQSRVARGIDANVAQRVCARELGRIGRTAVPFAQEVDTIHRSPAPSSKDERSRRPGGCEARSKRGIIAQWCLASDNSRSRQQFGARDPPSFAPVTTRIA